MSRRITAILSFWAFLFTCTTGWAAIFKASLDRDTILVGETAVLTLSFDLPSQGPPGLPNVRGLTFAFMGQSTMAQFVNGQGTTEYLYTYSVSAAGPGTFTIPSFRATLNNVTVASPPLTLKVVADEKGGAQQPSFVFLKLIVPKTNIYIGEVIEVQTPLYIVDGQVPQFPRLAGDGFVLGKQPQPTQGRTTVRNVNYHVVNFRQTVSAAKIGELTLGPAEVEAVARIPINNQRRGADPFDDFFSSFRNYEQRRVNLKSETVNITVLPLPKDNVPPSFNGAVGNFSFTMSAGPTNVSVGDPVTVRYVIRGRGNLDAVNLPNVDWREFKTYAPTVTVTNTDALGIEGTKTFEQVVIPQNAEIKALPEIIFTCFDPDQNTYRRTRGAAVPLHVTALAASQAQPTIVGNPVQNNEAQPASRDIVHIKNNLGLISPMETPLVRQPVFLGLQAVPIFAWIAALIWRRRKEHLARNPHLQRRLALQGSIKRGLKELAQQASSSKVLEFYSTLFRLLQEQIGERLDVPASGITEAALDERLELLALNKEDRVLLHELFQTCNQARYAPQASSGQLQNDLSKLEKALAALRDIPAK